MARIDLTGSRFGAWTVVGRDESRSTGKMAYWACRCDCGAERSVSMSSLKSGGSVSCGCTNKRLIDLTGRRSGRLVVLEYSHDAGTQNKPYWKCRCDCGKELAVQGASIKKGTSLSCGCLKLERLVARSTKHGHRPAGNHGTPTYESWRAMVGRCTESSHKMWRYYGGRGIGVCDRWRDFANFLADMGERPSGCTIDRYPNQDGNYEPGNCRWATGKQQQRNTSRNLMVTIGGDSKCFSEWAEIFGINVKTAHDRVNRGWNPVRALTESVHMPKLITSNGFCCEISWYTCQIASSKYSKYSSHFTE